MAVASRRGRRNCRRGPGHPPSSGRSVRLVRRHAPIAPANTLDGDRATFWRMMPAGAGVHRSRLPVSSSPHVSTASRSWTMFKTGTRWAHSKSRSRRTRRTAPTANGRRSIRCPRLPGFRRRVRADCLDHVDALGPPAADRGRTDAAAGAFTLSEVEFHGEAVAGAPESQSDLYRFSTDVVVTASRREQRTIDAPVSMTVIDRRQIESSPAENVADLLRGVPGLNVVEISARDVSITGRLPTSAFAQGQLVLVDGRSIVNDPNGIAFFDMMPVRFDEIDQIEVLHGPGSSLWGGDALTAVVNLRTKSPREMRGGLLTASVGSAAPRSIERTVGRRAGRVELQGFRQLLPPGAVGAARDAAGRIADARRFRVRQPADGAAAVRRAARLGSATTPGGGRSAPATRARPDRCSRRLCRWSSSSCNRTYADASYSSPGLDATVQFRRLVGHAHQRARRLAERRRVEHAERRRDVPARHRHESGAGVRRLDARGFLRHRRRAQPERTVSGRRVRGRPDRIWRPSPAESRRPARLHPDGRRGVLAAGERRVPAHDRACRFDSPYSRAYRPPTLIENYLFVPFPSISIWVSASRCRVSASSPWQRGTGRRQKRRHRGWIQRNPGSRRTRFRRPFYHVVVDGEIQFGTSEFYGPADPPPGWPLPPEFVPSAPCRKRPRSGTSARLRSPGSGTCARQRLVPSTCGRG